MSCGITVPAERTSAFNHYLDRTTSTDQQIGNFHKIFPGQWNHYFYICDASFASDERGVGNLNKPCKEIAQWSSEMYKGTSCKITFVFLVSIYSICILTVRLFSASDLTASSTASKTSHWCYFFGPTLWLQY